MQLRFDCADRLVELVEERGGPVLADEAARRLFALRQAPEGLARSLLGELVAGGRAARLARGRGRARRPPATDPLLEDATFVVFDLETTGLSPASARICEIGAVRVQGLELEDDVPDARRAGVPLPAPVGRLTGLADEELRARAAGRAALRRFSAFAGDAVLVAHNARFDVGVPRPRARAAARASGSRRPSIDTVALARQAARRPRRRGRASRRSRTSSACRRSRATARCPTRRRRPRCSSRLIGLAQERGARTLSELEELAAPRTRRVYGKRAPRPRRADAARRLPLPRPPRPGALRRQGARPARAAALVLPHASGSARGRGGARRGRADRVARARLRARRGARGAAADPRAAPAGERAHARRPSATST